MHTENSTWSRRYLGIPYVVHGASVDGVDCWGLVRLVYKEEKGILLPDLSSRYEDHGDKEAISNLFLEHRPNWKKVDVPKPLDCVMFNIYGRPVHIGVVVEEGLFLHAPEYSTTRIEFYTDRMWTRRIEGFYRYE